jgi:hypothetical protein
MGGKLYYCQVAAHGDALRGFPSDKRNYVNLFDEKLTKADIRQYMYRSTTIPACRYCTGWAIDAVEVPIAEQLNAPLEYQRYD